MVANEQGQEGIEQDKGGAKSGVRYDGQEGAEQVYLLRDEYVAHDAQAAGPSKYEQEALPIITVIGGTADAHHQQGLQEHAHTEGIHGKAGGVDLDAQDGDDALAIVAAAVVLLRAVAARSLVIGEEHAILPSETLQEDGDEGGYREGRKVSFRVHSRRDIVGKGVRGTVSKDTHTPPRWLLTDPYTIESAAVIPHGTQSRRCTGYRGRMRRRRLDSPQMT